MPPGASGADIYVLQSCGACHGEHGEGTDRAPALRGMAEHWTVERLAGYFVDPRAYVAADPRLAAVDERFSLRMPVYDNLTPAQARLLAEHVLGLE